MQRWLSAENTPVLCTLAVCLGLYGLFGALLPGFLAPQVAIGFFSENAFLGIAAIGMSIVILTGGIDLSVGAVVGCSSIALATMIAGGIHPVVAALVALSLGTVFGLAMGAIIHYFDQPPFLVTLAGMFFARGTAFVIRNEALSISHPVLDLLYRVGLPLGGDSRLTSMTVLYLLLVVLAWGVLRSTRFGRTVYAIGSNQQSAMLMGLPVARTRIAAYGACGFCSALGGVVYAVYTFSGNPTAGTMLELDAIAAVVIGGTLLRGGRGGVLGTTIGIAILGIIQTAIMFQGTLSSWWTKIAAGGLLLAFIGLQRLLESRVGGTPGKG
jgi:ribose/xylose/arabinose/galactoside ABC-type transport system permease subunit